MNRDGNREAAERVLRMEQLLDACAEATGDLARQLERMERLHDDMTELFHYYGSEAWHGDREADERGALPADLKRGVLTEDAVYDAISDARDAAFRMLELGTDILKNRI